MATTTSAPRPTPRPRADALRNRERIVVAAREMFVEDGPQVRIDEIARRAGVGNATVYRHFPDRRALVHGVVCHVFQNISQLAEAALADERDPFAALCTFVHESVDVRTSALCPMLADDFDVDHPTLVETRNRIEKLVGALLERAKESGQLRPDIAVTDLLLAVGQLTRPLPGRDAASSRSFAQRQLQVFLDGLMAPARSELPGTPITLEELRTQPCTVSTTRSTER
ncbi:TetR/AcrR family transcriptional regulator [Streptomyces sp. NPDC127068]|uniref:TetR/AcrR family transcriptional regulator n=1 Tax=Streptomyces sp. NPDC127068 TaxID=3347127 RepID=UPI00364FC29B